MRTYAGWMAVLVLCTVWTVRVGFAGEAKSGELSVDEKMKLAEESIQKCQETSSTKATPELIKKKVLEAAALLEKEGPACLNKFRGKDSDFLYAGTYIWVHDLDGVFHLHPIKPKMEGKPFLRLRGAGGKLIFVDMNKIASEKGEGWYQYQWPKPGEKTPSVKTSYIKLVEHGGKKYVVGSGAYDVTLEDMEK